jgi:hypothetical protein
VVGGLGRAGPGGEPLPDNRDLFPAESDGGECLIGQLVQPLAGISEVLIRQARI